MQPSTPKQSKHQHGHKTNIIDQSDESHSISLFQRPACLQKHAEQTNTISLIKRTLFRRKWTEEDALAVPVGQANPIWLFVLPLTLSPNNPPLALGSRGEGVAVVSDPCALAELSRLFSLPPLLQPRVGLDSLVWPL